MGLFERGGAFLQSVLKPDLQQPASERKTRKTLELSDFPENHPYRIFMEKQKNPEYLPSEDEIRVALDAKNFSDKTTQEDAWWKFVGRSGKQAEGSSEQEMFHHDILTKEYIERFGNYIQERAAAYGATTERPLMILEVGAGNGRFSHFLADFAQQKNIPVKIIASDSGQSKVAPLFPLEAKDAAIAVKEMRPDMVISCWMPPGVDFTSDFRIEPSVKEYILTGQLQGGTFNAGDNWKTWGIESQSKTEAEERGEDTSRPPFVRDGFEEVELENIEEKQMNRLATRGKIFATPDKRYNPYIDGKPVTYAFRRKNN